MRKVGHSFVEHAMRENGALLGGEQSGHFFCFDNYYGFDDALAAALHVLNILSKRNEPLSKILGTYPKVFQTPEKRPHCPDDKNQTSSAASRNIFQRRTRYFLSTARASTSARGHGPASVRATRAPASASASRLGLRRNEGKWRKLFWNT